MCMGISGGWQIGVLEPHACVCVAISARLRSGSVDTARGFQRASARVVAGRETAVMVAMGLFMARNVRFCTHVTSNKIALCGARIVVDHIYTNLYIEEPWHDTQVCVVFRAYILGPLTARIHIAQIIRTAHGHVAQYRMARNAWPLDVAAHE